MICHVEQSNLSLSLLSQAWVGERCNRMSTNLKWTYFIADTMNAVNFLSIVIWPQKHKQMRVPCNLHGLYKINMKDYYLEIIGQKYKQLQKCRSST